MVNLLGGDTEILKLEVNPSYRWQRFARMTPKDGSRLEVSTINCTLVNNYLPNNPSTTTTTTTTTTPSETTTSEEMTKCPDIIPDYKAKERCSRAQEGLDCPYGLSWCCGLQFPEIRVVCKSQQWYGLDVKIPCNCHESTTTFTTTTTTTPSETTTTEEMTKCPDIIPDYVDSPFATSQSGKERCSRAQVGLECHYGSQSCCGQQFSEIRVVCIRSISPVLNGALNSLNLNGALNLNGGENSYQWFGLPVRTPCMSGDSTITIKAMVQRKKIKSLEIFTHGIGELVGVKKLVVQRILFPKFVTSTHSKVRLGTFFHTGRVRGESTP